MDTDKNMSEQDITSTEKSQDVANTEVQAPIEKKEALTNKGEQEGINEPIEQSAMKPVQKAEQPKDPNKQQKNTNQQSNNKNAINLKEKELAKKFSIYEIIRPLVFGIAMLIMCFLPLASTCGVSVGSSFELVLGVFDAEMMLNQPLAWHKIFSLILILNMGIMLFDAVMNVIGINEVNVQAFKNQLTERRNTFKRVKKTVIFAVLLLVYYFIFLKEYLFSEIMFFVFLGGMIIYLAVDLSLLKFFFGDIKINIPKKKRKKKKGKAPKKELTPEQKEKRAKREEEKYYEDYRKQGYNVDDPLVRKKLDRRDTIIGIVGFVLVIAMVVLLIVSVYFVASSGFFRALGIDLFEYKDFFFSTHVKADSVKLEEDITISISEGNLDLDQSTHRFYGGNYSYYLDLESKLEQAIMELEAGIILNINALEYIEEMENLSRSLNACRAKMNELEFSYMEFGIRKEVTTVNKYNGSTTTTSYIMPTYYIYNKNVTKSTMYDAKEVDEIELDKAIIDSGTDFSQIKIQATIKYSDGSIRIIFVPTSAFASITEQSGKQLITWSDTYGTYSTTITIN